MVAVKVETLSSEDFYERFKAYSELFEKEAVIARNDLGVWITAILPHDGGEELYCQAWDFATYDTIKFVAFLKGKIVVGEAECNITEEELAKCLKELAER